MQKNKTNNTKKKRDNERCRLYECLTKMKSKQTKKETTTVQQQRLTNITKRNEQNVNKQIAIHYLVEKMN